MPGEFNGLQPPLQPGERAVVKSFGGWTGFMQSYGLRPYEQSHTEEGLAIVREMAKNDAQDAKAAAKSKGKK